MHRFLWDLTYPAPEVLTRDYPISAIYHDTPLYPLGATVLPANTSRAHRRRQELYANARTKDGPACQDSPEDLRRQFDLDARSPKLCTKTTKPSNKYAVCERK